VPGRGGGGIVALSFAGAQGDYVEQVAQALKVRGVRCFYDADEQIELCGKYPAEDLPAIYGQQAGGGAQARNAEAAFAAAGAGLGGGCPGG
jgi:hypothetical protein